MEEVSVRPREIKNAVIKSTLLGREDHGILTAFLNCEGDGWGCGFGGYALDEWNEAQRKRIGTAYGLQFVMEIMRVLDADSWEKLTGKHVRVEFDNGRISRIGHLLKEQWFDPESLKAFAEV